MDSSCTINLKRSFDLPSALKLITPLPSLISHLRLKVWLWKCQRFVLNLMNLQQRLIQEFTFPTNKPGDLIGFALIHQDYYPFAYGSKSAFHRDLDFKFKTLKVSANLIGWNHILLHFSITLWLDYSSLKEERKKNPVSDYPVSKLYLSWKCKRKTFGKQC